MVHFIRYSTSRRQPGCRDRGWAYDINSIAMPNPSLPPAGPAPGQKLTCSPAVKIRSVLLKPASGSRS